MRKVEDQHWPLNKKEYEYIYSKVPRLTVEIIVRDESRAIYMTRRSIDPCKDQWHLPGGTVQFGEPLIDAVHRVAMRELSIDVHEATNRGYIEYPLTTRGIWIIRSGLSSRLPATVAISQPTLMLQTVGGSRRFRMASGVMLIKTTSCMTTISWPNRKLPVSRCAVL